MTHSVNIYIHGEFHSQFKLKKLSQRQRMRAKILRNWRKYARAGQSPDGRRMVTNE